MHNENSGYPSEKAAGSFAGQLTLSMRLYVLLSFLLVSVVARAQTPDPTFGTDGHALLTATTGDAYATCMALQPDGKIVVGGVAYAGITASAVIARLTATGEYDTSFGDNGLVVIPPSSSSAQVLSIALQPDGKVVVAGTDDVGGTPGFAVWRLTAQGTLDNSFGDQGVYFNSFSIGGSSLTGVAVQPDGKIMTCGWFVSTTQIKALGALRLTTAGVLDTQFNGTGYRTVDGSALGYAYEPTAIALQPDGKVLIGGCVTDEDFDDHDPLCIRMTATGVMDASFGTNGFSISPIAGDDVVNAMQLMPDGRILLVGNHYGNTAAAIDVLVLRLGTTGALDPTFGTAPQVWDVYGPFELDYADCAALRADGGAMVCGSSIHDSSADLKGFIGQLTPSAAPDLGFGTDGHATVVFGIYARISACVFQPDGLLLVAGSNTEAPGDTSRLMVARYDVDNTVDITEVIAPLQLGLFPNPATDLLTVCSPHGLPSKATIRITDATGRVVLSAQSGSTVCLLDVSILADGLYQVDMVDAKEHAIGRFVKQ